MVMITSFDNYRLMWFSSRMLTGAYSNLDNCDATEYWLINTRYRTGLYVDSRQVRI
ncbi:hypothetical protein Hanom_Chr15g01407301 [Helianthus anomalus]